MIYYTDDKKFAKDAQSLIKDIAKKLDTTVIQAANMHGMMYVEYEPSMIEGPILDQRNCERYPNIQCRIMCLLHELGHVFHGHTQGRPPFQHKTHYFDNGVLKSEAEAWEFALDQWEQNFEIDLLPVTRDYMWRKCMNSYYQGSLWANGKPKRLRNGDRHYVEFLYDKPTEFFWSIRDRMLGEKTVKV